MPDSRGRALGATRTGSIENAMALCPNCHRERHYGINYANGATK